MGKYLTVFCPDDNSYVREMLSENGQQKILFIDGGKSKKVALLGDNLAELAITNNWKGIIVNGCVRDAEIISLMDLPFLHLEHVQKKA